MLVCGQDYEEGRADRQLSVAKVHIESLEKQVKEAKSRFAQQVRYTTPRSQTTYGAMPGHGVAS